MRRRSRHPMEKPAGVRHQEILRFGFHPCRHRSRISRRRYARIMRTSCRFVMMGLLLAAPATAWAHHSYAVVDMTRRATVEGTVTTLEWTNPHVWVWIAVDDGRGATVPYAFESPAPSELSRFFGWNRRILTPGQRITVEYAPFRNGDDGGALATITFTDGRVLAVRDRTGRPVPIAKDPPVQPAAPKEQQ